MEFSIIIENKYQTFKTIEVFFNEWFKMYLRIYDSSEMQVVENNFLEILNDVETMRKIYSALLQSKKESKNEVYIKLDALNCPRSSFGPSNDFMNFTLRQYEILYNFFSKLKTCIESHKNYQSGANKYYQVFSIACSLSLTDILECIMKIAEPDSKAENDAISLLTNIEKLLAQFFSFSKAEERLKIVDILKEKLFFHDANNQNVKHFLIKEQSFFNEKPLFLAQLIKICVLALADTVLWEEQKTNKSKILLQGFLYRLFRCIDLDEFVDKEMTPNNFTDAILKVMGAELQPKKKDISSVTLALSEATLLKNNTIKRKKYSDLQSKVCSEFQKLEEFSLAGCVPQNKWDGETSSFSAKK